MDDLNLEELDNPQADRQQPTLKEMSRRSNDRVRVQNITDQDFTVRWDGDGFVVPARHKDLGQGPGQRVLPRYVALNYLKHMTDHILGEQLVEAVKTENERRIASGNPVMSKHQDEEAFSAPFRTDNLEQRKKLGRMLWLGIDERYAADRVAAGDLAKPKDERPLEEQIADDLDQPSQLRPSLEAPVEPVKAPETVDTPVDDLSTKTHFELQKIARQQGVDFQKTDKKDELIRKLSR